MNDTLKRLIGEAIELELNVADLYLLFYHKFPEDSDFWWKLSIEEKNHAALLKTALRMTDMQVKIPVDLLPTGIEELKRASSRIRQYMIDHQIPLDGISMDESSDTGL
jgi:hypothetical protein